MASASAIASEDCHFSPGAPTVVQWVSSNGATQSIGTKPTHPVFAFIITHISPETAFFGLRTHIGLKEGGKTKTTINVFIYPEHITHLALKDPDSHPVPVLNAFTSRIPQYKSPEDIVGLTFSLQRPATAVGPSNATRLSPKTKPSEDFLISLNSLVQATEVTMFIPKNNNHVGRIKSLCIKACNGGLKASPYEYSLPRLYSGSGGKDIRDLLSRFREPSEGPPSYDELALSSPAPPPLRRGRRKRLSSSRGSPSPSPSKRRTGDPPVSAAEVQLMKQELARLTAEVAELRGDARSREEASPPPPPRRSPDTVERLQRVESAVSRLDERMQRVERTLEQAGLLVLTDGRVSGEGLGDDNLPTALVVDHDQTLLDTFGRRLDDLAADIDSEVDGKLDDMLSDIKDEVRGWAQEAYQELLETRLGEVVDEHLAQAAWTVRRCD